MSDEAVKADVSPKTAYRRWYKVAMKWVELGALDTEPRCVALNWIEDAYGIQRGGLDL